MKTIQRYTLAVALTVAGVTVLFFAVVGVACLYMTAPLITYDQECDVVQSHNGREWCMNLVTEQDAGKVPPMTVTEADGKSIEQTHNPQLTKNGKELQ